MMNTNAPPLTFAPLYMERVWGGRELERVYGRNLPEKSKPFGEAWELVDREDEQSVVDHGKWKGCTLHELWNEHRATIFGTGYESWGTRFPILMKILDARDDLSIQVHPPAEKAAELGGEPKTEMWYVADCDPGAKLYVGFRKGMTRERFCDALRSGELADCVHAIQPSTGESIFIPSGRLHAIGAGFLIHEIQQNSDTTYRVFDWNRLGLNGKPRDLHVDQSLASIDFGDFEPTMDRPDGPSLASCSYFATDKIDLLEGDSFIPSHKGSFSILSIIEGGLQSIDGRRFAKGDTLVLPVGAAPVSIIESGTVLVVRLPD